MLTIVDFDQFRDLLLRNAQIRSRTAKGSSDTKVSGLKLPLLLEGEELKRQVRQNMRTVAYQLHSRLGEWSPDPSWLKAVFELWFQSMQEKLIDFQGYQKKRVELGMSTAHPYYRIWEVRYDHVSPRPEDIASRMDGFYVELSSRIKHMNYAARPESLAEVMAFADRELDRVIHP